ncbi:cadherin-13 isoform 2 precursor [Gallus gallus]|uniref:Cadherin-13 n=1 Tax=Gallus gallus TaxID=9031 RepID=CAD13_CHICK|nr:cadherin-13 isoform 2 precursor [Gallus gallus]P33150.1 RecName: Full=Cadherin-13; AltName: Full=Truncated cadherin; Short=T-cad; Short=T-cadherin; Flags: Precursor [Gallus gallus]AAA49079.1 T-cadherin [Gallus gallus]|eukprot:XP_015148010.1 cadherin-13 isoform X4 [Gallus gallus]
MQHKTQLTLSFLLSQVLLLACAEDLECTPGFQQKVFYIEQPFEFTEDQPILNLVFDDCKGNNKLNFEVSNPDFKVEHDGSLVALKNVSEAGRALFVHARSEHAEDMAEILIVGADEKHDALKEIFKIEGNLGIPRQKRAILATPILIPENQRPPFPRSVGKVIRSEGTEGAKFRLSGKGVDQDPKGIFRINEISGDVSVTRPLDREAIANYELEVEVTDLSGKIIDGPVRLDISVIDQNDNRPMFKEGPYVGHVMEGSPTGTTVMRMTAFDADDPSTDNALLRYNILKQTPTKPSPNMFYIDPEKGDIVTVVSPVLLDRETMETPKYELVIEAKDMGGHDVGLTGTATATILIDDKNDHPPEFTKKEFQATVKEGVTGVIVNLTVGDRDDPATGAWRAVYTIINGNPGQSFEIHTNPQTNEGMLSVVKPLDYEISAFHTLLIKVENEDPLIPDIAYGPSSTATVQITVEDVNEGPVFHPNPMTVTKQENIPIGSIVLTVNATDPDTLQHQTIRYSVYKDPASWLEINPTNGTVATTAVLDRESPHVQDNKYTALFLAIDSGNPPATGTGTLHITLEDVNDNVPSLYPTLAKVCDDAKDLRVVVLGASDKDLHPNTDPFKFELSKQSGPEKLWRINKLNNTHAQVVLLQNLKKANYNIPISVTDSGKPPLTNNTELKLQVCSCKKSRMDCSASDALHISMTLILLSLFSLFCL